MKKYIVIDRHRKMMNGGLDFVSESTENLNEIWITSCGKDVNEPEELKPRIFEKRSDAVEYKDAAQLQANVDWRENSYIHKRYGDQKPKFKVEEYTDIQNMLNR